MHWNISKIRRLGNIKMEMYLKRKGSKNIFSKAEVNFEIMGEKFILINIKYNYIPDDILNDSPYYWRLVTDNHSPPLEISVNIEPGNIHEITMFISEEDFGEPISDVNCRSYNENTNFYTNLFQHYDYYFDSKGEYVVSLKDTDLQCFFNNEKPTTIINQNENVSYYLNNEDYLIGLSIKNLESSALSVLFQSNLININ
jgi:hypothetical protein